MIIDTSITKARIIMDNYLRLKIDSLQMQLEIIKTQHQRSEQSKTGKTGGLKQLRDLLKGNLDVSEQDLLDSQFTFKDVS
jgi:hypothetical protein